jgi:glycerate 2-kinase
MMRIVIAPDKFKGSLGATEVAAAIAAGLRAGLARAEPPGAERPGAELVTIPVADGGEGTVDAAVAAGFERVLVTAAGRPKCTGRRRAPRRPKSGSWRSGCGAGRRL